MLEGRELCTSMLYPFHMNNTSQELIPQFSTNSRSKPHLFSAKKNLLGKNHKPEISDSAHINLLRDETQGNAYFLRGWKSQCLIAGQELHRRYPKNWKTKKVSSFLPRSYYKYVSTCINIRGIRKKHEKSLQIPKYLMRSFWYASI